MDHITLPSRELLVDLAEEARSRGRAARHALGQRDLLLCIGDYVRVNFFQMSSTRAFPRSRPSLKLFVSLTRCGFLS